MNKLIKLPTYKQLLKFIIIYIIMYIIVIPGLIISFVDIITNSHIFYAMNSFTSTILKQDQSLIIEQYDKIKHDQAILSMIFTLVYYFIKYTTTKIKRP
jgi:hypothetical protein